MKHLLTSERAQALATIAGVVLMPCVFLAIQSGPHDALVVACLVLPAAIASAVYAWVQ